MVNWNDIQVALKCTAENLFIILPVLLLSGAAAYFVGWAVRGRVKKAKAALVPLIIAEFVLCLAMLPYLNRWVGMQSFTWGFWYEGGLDFFLPFSAMIGLLIGYLLGMAFREKKAQGE